MKCYPAALCWNLVRMPLAPWPITPYQPKSKTPRADQFLVYPSCFIIPMTVYLETRNWIAQSAETRLSRAASDNAQRYCKQLMEKWWRILGLKCGQPLSMCSCKNWTAFPSANCLGFAIPNRIGSKATQVTVINSESRKGLRSKIPGYVSLSRSSLMSSNFFSRKYS